MANPNIVNVSSIYGNSAFLRKGVATSDTVPSSEVGTHNILANPSSSGKIFKLNSLLITPIKNDFSGLSPGGGESARAFSSTTEDPRYSIIINSGGTDYHLVNDKIIPEGGDTAFTKDSGIYLTENQTIKFFSSTNNTYYNTTDTLSYYSLSFHKRRFTWILDLELSYEEIS